MFNMVSEPLQLLELLCKLASGFPDGPNDKERSFSCITERKSSVPVSLLGICFAFRASASRNRRDIEGTL